MAGVREALKGDDKAVIETSKGGITVEFFAGPKMDQDRGRKYEYAADINAVIAADGTIVYTPGFGYVGSDAFDYTIEAGGRTASASVSVTVHSTGPFGS